MDAGHYQLLTGKAAAGIAVVRIWGATARQFLKRHTCLANPVTLTAGAVRRTALIDAAGEPVDDTVVSVGGTAAAPVYWLHLHGNPFVIQTCCMLAHQCGLVESDVPVWPAGDAIERDALQLLPDVLTLRGATWLLDQVKRLRSTCDSLAESCDLEHAQSTCRELLDRRQIITWFIQPLRVALVGPPNAGKSSLANALGDQTASIVSDEPGTTRDWVEVPAEVDGFPVIWIDTAGLRVPADEIEAAGIAQTQDLLAQADAAILVLDRDDPTQVPAVVQAWQGEPPAYIALNKADLSAAADAVRTLLPAAWADRTLDISATAGVGLDQLRQYLLAHTGRTGAILDQPAAFCDRQARLCAAAAEAESCNAMRQIMLELAGVDEFRPTVPPNGLPQSSE